jgi:hypothetical protein
LRHTFDLLSIDKEISLNRVVVRAKPDCFQGEKQ